MMINEIVFKRYVDFKVYSVTNIKDRYGYRIVLTLEDGSIKTKQKSGFNTKKEANDSRNNTITELHNGTYVVEDNVKVKDFFTYWLEKVKRLELSNDGYNTYKNAVYNRINNYFKNKSMVAINRGDIVNFYYQEAERSLSVAKICKCVIDSGFKYAKLKNIVSVNVAKGVLIPKEFYKANEYRVLKIDTSKTFDMETLKLIIEKSKNTPIHLQILFAILLGLRISEINGLKYSDVDFVKRTIKIQRQLGKKANASNEEIKKGEITKQEIAPKTFSSIRELELPDLLFETILEERKKYEQNRNRRINDKTTPFKDYDYICCSTYGNPRCKGYHSEHWTKFLIDNNLPHIKFHGLRASYCTMLLQNNFNAKAVSKQLGHASEIISVDVYGDNDRIIEDCCDYLEPFIESVIPKNKNNDFSNDEEVIKIMDGFINQLIN